MTKQNPTQAVSSFVNMRRNILFRLSRINTGQEELEVAGRRRSGGGLGFCEFRLVPSGTLPANNRMHRPGEFCCVLVTAPNITVARKVAAAALKEHLAACANLVPKVESHYWWQGQLESSSEVLILFKTTKERLEELESNVVRNHPYDTPEFVVLKIKSGAGKYLDWISASVNMVKQV